MSSPSEKIDFYCPHCRYEFVISAGSAAVTIVCPDCDREVEIPRFETVQGLPNPTTNSVSSEISETDSSDTGESSARRRDDVGGSVPAVIDSRSNGGRPIFTSPDRSSAFRQFRAWCFRTMFESRAGLIALVTVISVGGIGAWMVWQQSNFSRNENRVLASWEEADVAFRQAQFDVAKTGYQKVIDRSEQWGRFGRKDRDLARRMKTLCESAAVIAGKLDSKNTPVTAEMFQELRQVLLVLSGDEKLPELVSAPPGATTTLPVGLKFSAADRARDLIDEWLTKRAVRLASELSGNQPPPQGRVGQLESLAAFLGQWGRATASLDKTCQAARTRIEQTELAAEFKSATVAAIENYSAKSVDGVYQAWKKLAAKNGDGNGGVWSEFVGELRSRLRDDANATREEPVTDASGTLAVVVPESAPLPGGGQPKPIPDDHAVVFVCDEDRLIAFDSRIGQPSWAIRRGFIDTRLPARDGMGKAVCAVTWQRDDKFYLSVLETHTGINRWTCLLPTMKPLRQSPLFHDRFLLVPLPGGVLLQLDSSTGKTVSRIRLPEELASPCVLDADSDSLACLGRHLATYIVGLKPRLSVKSVQIRNAEISLDQAQAVWVHSFLLVFTNLPDSTCRLTTFRFNVDDGQLLECQDLSFDGHIWQPPQILGLSAFLGTDSGFQAMLRITPDSDRQTVKLVWSSSKETLPLGTRPYMVTHAEAPVVVAHQKTVRAFFLAIREGQSTVERRSAWTWSFPVKEAIAHQPPQLTPDGIVIAARQPDQAGVLLVCLETTSGKPQWSFGFDDQSPPAEKPSRSAAVTTPLRVGHFSVLNALDPWNASVPLEREIVPLLFDRLLEPGIHGSRYVKGPLVTGYQLARGGQRSKSGAFCEAFRFQLDGDRQFHDGTLVDAQDVVDSVRLLSESRVNWHQQEQSRMLRSTRRVAADRVEILVRPYLASRSLLNLFVVPGKHYPHVPEHGSSLSFSPIGSGRFQVAANSTPANLTLRRSKRKTDDPLRPDGFREIVFQRFTSAQIADLLAKFREGSLDVIAGLGPGELRDLRKRGVDGRVVSLSHRRVAVLVLNHRRLPFDDPAIRFKLARVLGHSFREDLVRSLADGPEGSRVVDGVFPPGSVEPPFVASPPLDEVLVNRYLREIRKVASRDLTLKFQSGDQLVNAAVERIVKRLSSQGLSVVAQERSIPRFHEEVTNRTAFDMAVCVLDHTDPLLNLGGLFDPRSPNTNVSSRSFLGLDSQFLLQLLVDTRNAGTLAGLLTARRKIDDFIRDESILVPLWTQPQFAVFSPELKMPPTLDPILPGRWLFHRIAEWRRIR